VVHHAGQPNKARAFATVTSIVMVTFSVVVMAVLSTGDIPAYTAADLRV
jgi:hypothetical protein